MIIPKRKRSSDKISSIITQIEPEEKKNDYIRKLSYYEQNQFSLGSLINFEYLKSFTSLTYEDIILTEKFYRADICDLWKGKYKSLTVAVKVYNISRLTEEYLVK
jgi:hypothetical protein